MAHRTSYGQAMRRCQFRESDNEDHMHTPIGGHLSPSDIRFDSPSPQTPHPSNDGPSSSLPPEVKGSSTPIATLQNRPMIRPLGSSFDNNLCKRDISRIIQSKFEQPYPSWKKTNPTVREMWFGEFKKKWSWESELENQIRANFEKTASDRMIDLLFRVRRDLTKKPYWMCPTVFEALKEYWNTPEFKDKSKKAKRNRASNVGGSMYTCGSKSTSKHKKHKKRLYTQFGCPPTQTELFLATHKRKDNSGFVDKKSGNTYADFQTHQHDASSQASAVSPSEGSDASRPSQPVIDETSLRLEIADGKKKDHVCGMGSEPHVIPGSKHVPSPSPQPPPPPSSISLADQIQQAIKKAMEPFDHHLSALEGRFQDHSSLSLPSNP